MRLVVVALALACAASDEPPRGLPRGDDQEGFTAKSNSSSNKMRAKMRPWLGEGFGAITGALDLIKYNYLAQRDLITSLEDQITKKDKELEAKESEIESLEEHISKLKDHLSRNL